MQSKGVAGSKRQAHWRIVCISINDMVYSVQGSTEGKHLSAVLSSNLSLFTIPSPSPWSGRW